MSRHVYRNPARVTVESGGSDWLAVTGALIAAALLAAIAWFVFAYAAILIAGMVAAVIVAGAGVWVLHRYFTVQFWHTRAPAAPAAAEARTGVGARATAALPAGAPPAIEPARILNIHFHGAAQPEGMAAVLKAIAENEQGRQS